MYIDLFQIQDDIQRVTLCLNIAHTSQRCFVNLEALCLYLPPVQGRNHPADKVYSPHLQHDALNTDLICHSNTTPQTLT